MPTKRKRRRPSAIVPPLYIERTYAAILRRLIAREEAQVKETIIPHLPEIESRVRLEQGSLRRDAWPDDVVRLTGTLTTAYETLTEPIPEIARGVGKQVDRWHQKQWIRTMQKTIGVRLFSREPWLENELKSFSDENVQLVTKLSTEVKSEVSATVQRGFRAGKRAETIAQEITEGTKLKAGVFKKARNRATLIARDQVAKLAGNINRLRQQSLGIQKYIWRTAIDERVRSGHRIMEGRLCRWDDSTVYRPRGSDNWVPRPAGAVLLHPGEDIQCRCYGEPWFEDIEEDLQIGEAA